MSAPIEALTVELTLTADQKKQVAGIQKKTHDQLDQMRPDPNAPPDPRLMRDSFQKAQGVMRQAQQSITALLTPDQQKAVPATLKDIRTLRSLGIPAETMADLNLT
ncbi:MAG: hypothetical protein JO157_09535, partial [Acetobacteraceae bacterium]|nr:hypothetical protein [Acetobacteraceae bacterium]